MTTQQLFQDWVSARRYRETCSQRLQEADKTVAAKSEELAKHMLPQDAKPGENFYIWVNGETTLAIRDILVGVALDGKGAPIIWLRDYVDFGRIDYPTEQKEEDSDGK